jgi:hypothetical protein
MWASIVLYICGKALMMTDEVVAAQFHQAS